MKFNLIFCTSFSKRSKHLEFRISFKKKHQEFHMALGRRFMEDKYGMLSQWATEEVMGTFGCNVWKTIRRL